MLAAEKGVKAGDVMVEVAVRAVYSVDGHPPKAHSALADTAQTASPAYVRGLSRSVWGRVGQVACDRVHVL